MALEDIDVPINLTGGLDTKTDPKQVVVGKLLSLTNARYKTLQSYVKRNGYQALSTSILGGGSITNGVGVAAFQSQLNLYDGASFYSYNESTSDWSNKGSLISLNFNANSIIKNSNNQTSQDSGYNSGISVYAWEDSSGGIRYSVIDQVTNDPIVDNAVVLSTAENPRVAVVGVYLVIFYVNTSTNQIAYNSINITTPENLSTATSVTSDLNAMYQIFDVNTINGLVYIGYTTTTPSIAFYSLNSSLVLSSKYAVGTDYETAISLAGDASNNVWASYYNGTAVKTLVVNGALNTTVLAPTVVETLANVGNVTGLVNGTTETVLYDQTLTYTTSTTSVINVSATSNSSENAAAPQTQINHTQLYDQPFVATQSGALESIIVDLSKGTNTETAGGTIGVSIRADNAGVPGTTLASTTIPASAIVGTSIGNFVTASISGVNLVASITYHLVLDTTNLTWTGGSGLPNLNIGVLGTSSLPLLPLLPALYYTTGNAWVNMLPNNSDSYSVWYFNVSVQQTITTTTTLAPNATIIRDNTMTLAGTAGTPSTLIRSVGLASKAFGYNSQTWIACAYPSTLQGKYFLINTLGQEACRYSGEPNLGGGLTAKNLLPGINLISTGLYQLSYLQVDQITETPAIVDGLLNEVATIQTGVMQGLFNFQPTNTFTSLSLGNNLNLSGALPTIYDGNNVTEQGINIYPENILGGILNIGGALSSGEYQYAFTYEWIDNQGQVDRSAPSVAFTIQPGQTQYLSGALSTTTQVTAASGSNLSQIFQGQGITDQLGKIPAATTVSSTVNTSSQFAISQAASTTETVDTFDLLSTYQVGVNFVLSNNSSSGLNTVRVNQLQFLPILINYTNTSNIAQLVNIPVAQYLVVGMTLTDASGALAGSSNTAVINAINTTTGQITLSVNSGKTIQNSISTVSSTILANLTNTSNLATITSATTQQLASLVTNGRVFSGNITGSTDLIGYISGSTFTFQQSTSSTTSSQTIYIGIDIRALIVQGQTLTGIGSTPGIVGTGTIASVVGGPETDTTSIVTFTTQVITGAYTGLNTPDAQMTLANMYQIDLVIPTLRVTNKSGVNIVVYRTLANGTVFYKVATLPNNPLVDFIQYTDQVSDYVALDGLELYTTGGVVINTPAPPTNLQVEYNNREIIVPNENPFSFWYSKQVIPGTPVQFSDEFINNVDSRGGGITAIGVMDDKLIMFKQSIIFYLVAQGPGTNGANNDFTSGTQVVTPVGCVNQKSIVSMPGGLMFQASGGNGIWLLSRDLGTQYIGADVEAYNSYTVTSTQLVPTATEVRFSLSNGTILVYDYFVGKWSVDLNLSAADSCNFQNLFGYLNSNGTFYQETPGTYTDNGAFIPLGLTTSWLSFAELQGYQRVKEFLVLGQYYTPHTLQVQFAYNFNPAVIQTDSIPVSSNPNPYQFRLFHSVQKAQAVQITLTEQQSGTYGQGLSISGFNFIVGKKKGHFKMPAAASYG